MGQQNGKEARRSSKGRPSVWQDYDLEDPGLHNRPSSSGPRKSSYGKTPRSSSVKAKNHYDQRKRSSELKHPQKKSDKLPLTETERRKTEEFADIKLRTDTENEEQDHYWRFNFRKISNLCSRIFRLPFIPEPLNYVNVAEYHVKSDKYFDQFNKETEASISPRSSLIIEMDLNFKEEGIGLYDDIANSRIGGTESELFDVGKLNKKEFDGWNSEDFQILKRTFKLFDKNGDGVVDFYEWSEVIDEFGDTTKEDERKFYYDMVDPEGLGTLDFSQFCTLMYNLTMRPVGNSSTANPVFQSSSSITGSGTDIPKVRFSPAPGAKGIQGSKAVLKEGNIITQGAASWTTIPSSESLDGIDDAKLRLLPLGETLRRVNKNIQRISAMDVIQQLQAGVF